MKEDGDEGETERDWDCKREGEDAKGCGGGCREWPPTERVPPAVRAAAGAPADSGHLNFNCIPILYPQRISGRALWLLAAGFDPSRELRRPG